MWLDMSRGKNGRYKRKHKELKKHLFIACVVIWAVVILVDIPSVFGGKSTIEIVRASSIGAEIDSANTVEDNTDTLVARGTGVQPDDEERGKPVKDVVSLSDESIEGKIRQAWVGTGQEDIAVAVAKGESGLHQYAMGWNCYYYTAEGKKYSDSCKPEDRGKAWSVDCGVLQINKAGKNCPSELFDVDHNIKIGRGLYDTRGFNPWVAYTNGQYLNHMQ